MIYWFTGQPGHGKTTLGKLLKEHLESNGKMVFHIDGDTLRDMTNNYDYSETGRNKNIESAQTISRFLHKSGFDVIVSLVSPYRKVREEFKDELTDDILEIYVKTSEERGREKYHVEDYEPPLRNYLELDTTLDTEEDSLTLIKERL